MLNKHRRKRSPFFLIFASFFGAAMVAGAFAYYNYEFSKYKFFDFNKIIFYQKSKLFKPTDKEYIILVYSSNMQSAKGLVTKIKKGNKILAIDLYQKRFKEEDSIIYLTSGTNSLLKFIQKFNIYDVPCVFKIKKIRDLVYKQDTKIEVIE